MKALIVLALMAVASASFAGERIGFCYNWSCVNEAAATFPEAFLAEIGRLLLDAGSPAHERELLAVAVGRMYGWAAARLPIGADRAGNDADADADGRMDCIDHSNTTTRILASFERRGWLRFHRVLEPQFRNRFIIAAHRSAMIEEWRPGSRTSAGDLHESSSGARFAVDTWYVDPGTTPPVVPLEKWLQGRGSDVE